MPTTPMSGNRCPEGQELWSGDNTCRTLYTFYYKARRVVAGGNEVCSYHQQRAPDVQNAENILLRNLGGPRDIWNIERIDEERYRRNWDNNSYTERMRM
jgi:hypothetical protein